MDATMTGGGVDLSEFLRRIAALSDDDFTLASFSTLAHELELPDRLLEEHVHFSEESYARNLLIVTPRFEMVVMCWQSGQLSTVHDHLDSFAMSLVLSGVLLNRNFRRLDDGEVPDYAELQLINEELFSPGSWLSLDLGAIHQMGNAAGSSEPLVTLHFYARPLREINVFHPSENRAERVRLAYSMLHF